MEEKGLGDMEKGRGVSANCLFSVPRFHRHNSRDIFQILTGKIRASFKFGCHSHSKKLSLWILVKCTIQQVSRAANNL